MFSATGHKQVDIHQQKFANKHTEMVTFCQSLLLTLIFYDLQSMLEWTSFINFQQGSW